MHSGQDGEDTRTRLLVAAEDAFARLGYDAAGVAQICSLAGASKGAFYHHFASKHDLLLEVMQRRLASLEAALTSDDEGERPPAQVLADLVARLSRAIRCNDRDVPLFLEFWTQAQRDDQARSVVVAAFRRYQGFLTEVYRRGLAAGALAEQDAVTGAQVLVLLGSGLYLAGVVDPEGYQALLPAIDSVLRALGRRE